MRLLVLSDLHLDTHRHWKPAPTPHDAVVLAGDIAYHEEGVLWAARTFTKPTFYVLGNHEYRGDDLERALRHCRRVAAGTQVTVLEREAVDIDGHRILGCTLWSDFAAYGNAKLARQAAAELCADFQSIEYRDAMFRPEHCAELHRQSVAWLEQELDACRRSGRHAIVVTHFPPIRGHHPPEVWRSPLAPYYAGRLEGLLGSHVPIWIHGHTHQSRQLRVNGTLVVCNPMGYADESIPGFSPDLVIDTDRTWAASGP